MSATLRRALVALLLVHAFPGAAPAQQADSIALEGRVLDPTGAALPGQAVLLHRVTTGGGATIAADTSDANGRFTLAAGGLEPSPGATYFVAARYEGELYIGPPFQPPLPPAIDYTVQVGVPGTSASALMGGGRTAPARSAEMADADPFPYRLWILLIIPLLVVALAAGYLLTRQRTPVRRRRTLLEIAELDEAHDAELAAGHVADSTLYWAERRALLERLQHES